MFAFSGSLKAHRTTVGKIMQILNYYEDVTGLCDTKRGLSLNLLLSLSTLSTGGGPLLPGRSLQISVSYF